MKTIGYVCIRCGHRFDHKTYEPGEAQQKGLPSAPIRCPECGGNVRQR